MASNPRDGAGVVPGLVDTGLASLATFVVGLAATGLLTEEQLGAYAIFFTGFVLATTLPTNLILLPIEVWLVGKERERRFGYVGRSLVWGAAAAVISVVPYGLLVPISSGREVSESVLVALWLTGTAAGLLSPLQDHLRRLFHLGGRGELAAVTSAAQLGAVAVALVVLRALDLERAWIPLGALAIANLCSLLLGLALAGRAARPGSDPAELQLRPVLHSGRWLLVQGVVPIGAGFIVTLIVGGIAGLAVLGRAEAARIVAQPLFVLGGGLNASLGPQSMEAGAAPNRRRAVRLRRTYWRLFVPLGLLYLAVVSWNQPFNPMSRLVEVAYENSGLVLVAGIGALLTGLGLPARSELLGLREERGLTRSDTGASVVRVAVAAATAPFLGAFSLHVATVADGAVKTAARIGISDRRFTEGET